MEINLLIEQLSEALAQMNEGTSNFAYEHRCVVVSDEDYENDNVPRLDEKPYDYDRNYPSYSLYDYSDKFNCWVIVLTAGYYEGACIDYVEKEGDYLYNFIEDEDYLAKMPEVAPNSTKEEIGEIFGNALNDEYTSKQRILDYVDGYFDETPNSQEEIQELWLDLRDSGYGDRVERQIFEEVAEQEEVEVNKIIDQIIQDYGYTEYETYASFSNGETWYSPKK